MATPTVRIELPVNSLIALRDFLNTRREAEYWSLNTYSDSKDGFVDEDGRVLEYRVTSAERALAERAKLADMISWLTGEAPAEKTEDIARIADARVRYDAQEAARKAEEAAKPTLEVVE